MADPLVQGFDSHSTFIPPPTLPIRPVADVLVKDGIKIRCLKSGRCVREDEWTEFVQINDVHSP